MRFSIITCTFNSEPFLAQSIASVLAQDYPELEYIFVDGGSTDGTLAAIAAIERPVKVVHGVGGGIAKAMNAGIRAATGDVIAHMHSDDYYLGPDVLTRVAAALARHRGHWAFGRVMSDIDGRLLAEGYAVPRYRQRTLLRRNFIPHAATFVKRSVFEEFGMFDESYRLAMDYEMWLRLARHHDPVQLDDYLAAFRYHPGSATQANALGSCAEDFRARLAHAHLAQYPEFIGRYLVRRLRLHSRLRAGRRPAARTD